VDNNKKGKLIFITKDLKKKLKHYSELRGITQHRAIIEAIEEYLGRRFIIDIPMDELLILKKK
jgi:hypothetical protein